jgi:hypothetical protein
LKTAAEHALRDAMVPCDEKLEIIYWYLQMHLLEEHFVLQTSGWTITPSFFFFGVILMSTDGLMTLGSECSASGGDLGALMLCSGSINWHVMGSYKLLRTVTPEGGLRFFWEKRRMEPQNIQNVLFFTKLV